MTEADVRRIFQEEYQSLGSRMGVNQTPTHSHNGIDSPQLDPNAVNAFIKLSAIKDGVVYNANQANQPIAQAYPQLFASKSNLYSPSVPYITGFGVGDASAFNGGDAPDGSLMLFSNGDGINQLWWHVGGVWRGINVSNVGTISGLTV